MLAGLVLMIAGANWFFLQRPVAGELARDKRNAPVTAYVYARWGVDPRTLIFDLWTIDGSASMLDVTRVLLQTAEALKDYRFSSVILAHRGVARFSLDGDYFHRLGAEYSFQNPVYTIRTLPQNVKHLDGRAAFGTWTGGLLGVVKEQMEDGARMHRQWYLDEMAASGALR